ncbi:protein SKIP34 [Actinidia eriantha]|uniref:protein SKIP34 n=1 Tax=Actinidia eriantha TaxID=165200 RepID=UPI00258DEDC4|nr:protein SKIP34 [Actinidia eriantha]
MCYGPQRLLSEVDDLNLSRTRPPLATEATVVDLRHRLAATEARLDRARAREAELTRRLNEMKRFVSVMEILETYLKRRFREQQESVVHLLSPVSTKLT